jgi:hypothetical protein
MCNTYHCDKCVSMKKKQTSRQEFATSSTLAGRRWAAAPPSRCSWSFPDVRCLLLPHLQHWLGTTRTRKEQRRLCKDCPRRRQIAPATTSDERRYFLQPTHLSFTYPIRSSNTPGTPTNSLRKAVHHLISSQHSSLTMKK